MISKDNIFTSFSDAKKGLDYLKRMKIHITQQHLDWYQEWEEEEQQLRRRRRRRGGLGR